MSADVFSIISPDSVSHASPGTSVSARGIRQEFDGGVVALDGIDLAVRAGEFLAILGPSGCGKSTLLRIIAGLDKPTAGTISVTPRGALPPVRSSSDGKGPFPSPGTPGEGQGGGLDRRRDRPPPYPPPEYREREKDWTPHTGASIDRRRADVAYVFQDAHLLPWRTVLRNVALPLELMGVARKARLETSQRAIERVGLAEAAGRYPNQLSGGMRMRVSLARAMVTDPKLLLLDEPFAALDEITRQQLDEQLRGLWAARGMTIVFVTHSTAEAAFLATRAMVMSPRPGRIVLDRSIELPAVRNGLLRATPEFARETRFLYEALEQGTNHS